MKSLSTYVKEQVLIERTNSANDLIRMMSSGKWLNRDEVETFLADRGATMRGKGFFGEVWYDDIGPWAIRLSRQWSIDATPTFAALVLKERLFEKNPLFPEIKYVGQLPDKTTVIILEKLEINPGKVAKLFNYLPTKTIFTHLIKRLEDPTTQSSALFKFVRKILGVSPDHLIEYLMFVKPLKPSIIMRSDLHAKNIGFRKNGQIVLFDP